MAAVDRLFRTTIAEAAAGGPTLVLIDEVEALVTSRASLSFETNPVDVHRAVDAALTGLDSIARDHPELLIVATTNFEQAIDEAFRSRVDYVFRVPLPDQAHRATILTDTIRAMASAFGGLGRLLEPGVIERLALASDGLDARRLRKSLAAACALDEATAADPSRLDEPAVLEAIKIMRDER